jgi:hypothetical protein
MNFNHRDMPYPHHVGFMYPDKIRRRHKVKNVTHIFTDQYISVIEVNGNIIAVLFQV